MKEKKQNLSLWTNSNHILAFNVSHAENVTILSKIYELVRYLNIIRAPVTPTIWKVNPDDVLLFLRETFNISYNIDRKRKLT